MGFLATNHHFRAADRLRNESKACDRDAMPSLNLHHKLTATRLNAIRYATRCEHVKRRVWLIPIVLAGSKTKSQDMIGKFPTKSPSRRGARKRKRQNPIFFSGIPGVPAALRLCVKIVLPAFPPRKRGDNSTITTKIRQFVEFLISEGRLDLPSSVFLDRSLPPEFHDVKSMISGYTFLVVTDRMLEECRKFDALNRNS